MKKKRNKIKENAVTGDKPVAAFFVVIKIIFGGQKELLFVLSAILQNKHREVRNTSMVSEKTRSPTKIY